MPPKVQEGEGYNIYNQWPGPVVQRQPSYSHLPGQDTSRDPWAPDEPQAYHQARPVQQQPASGQAVNQQYSAYANQYSNAYSQQAGQQQTQPQPQYYQEQSSQLPEGYDPEQQYGSYTYQNQYTYAQHASQQQSSGGRQHEPLDYQYIPRPSGFWKDWTNRVIQSNHFNTKLDEMEKSIEGRGVSEEILRTIKETARQWSAEEEACGSNGRSLGFKARAVERVAAEALRVLEAAKQEESDSLQV